MYSVRPQCNAMQSKIKAKSFVSTYFKNLKSLPGKIAVSPNASSIRRSWLYLAIRSEREADPVLICPVFKATAKSAIVLSSVSPYPS